MSVAVGDTVSEGQTLLEIEAGKATMEIPSPADGTITALHVSDGDTVEPGHLALEIDTEGQGAGAGNQEAEPEPEPEPAQAEPEPAPTPDPRPQTPDVAPASGGGSEIQFNLPELGENIESGEVTNVPVAVGDAVSEGQTLLEIEAGKATMDIPSPAAGTITALHVKSGDSVTPGQLALEIKTSAAAAPTPKAESKPEPEPEKPAPAPAAEEQSAPAPAPAEEPPAPKKPKSQVSKALAVSASPKVRKLARELGVDIHLIPASGPCGYITAEDVKTFAKEGLSSGGGAPAGQRTKRVEK